MAKRSTNMDLQELMAYDLEFRQQQRFRATKFKDTFFDRPVENSIRKQIYSMRSISTTYIPGDDYQTAMPSMVRVYLTKVREQEAKDLLVSGLLPHSCVTEGCKNMVKHANEPLCYWCSVLI